MASLAKACRCSSKDFDVVRNNSVQVNLRIQFPKDFDPTGDGCKDITSKAEMR